MRSDFPYCFYVPEERYEIEMEPSVLKALRDLLQADQRRVIARIRRLADDPRPRGCEKLGPDEWRVRQGSFRVIYRVLDPDRLVVVTRVGDRKDIYRRR